MNKTVFFRAFEESDLEVIYKWLNDDNLKKLSIGLNRRMSSVECISWINAKKNQGPFDFFWAICSLKTGQIIGYASLNDVHYINRTAFMGGMIIGDQESSSSFALFETMLFQLDFAFNSLNMHRVYESYMADHETSRLIASAFMYKLDGIFRDHLYKNGVYHDEVFCSLLEDEYHLYCSQGLYEIKAISKRIIEARKHDRHGIDHSKIVYNK